METRICHITGTCAIVAFAWAFGSHAASAQQVADTIRYPNGVLQEVSAKNAQGLTVGQRRFYDRRGLLIEEHVFEGGASQGVLRTFFNDTTVASVVPVQQKVDGQEYVLEVRPNSTVYGLHERSEIKSYEFRNVSPIHLPNQNYQRFNHFYNDPFLHRTRVNVNLNALVTFYDKYGIMTSEKTLIGGVPDGLARTYYPNKQLKSEGHMKTVNGSESLVGKWTFWYSDGIIERKVEFYGGEPSGALMNYGALINQGIYNHPNGQLQYWIEYPRLEDTYHRTDTIESYYETGQLRSRLDWDNRVTVQQANGDASSYQYSGFYEEFYPNGKPKVKGYVVKPPRMRVPTPRFDSHLMDEPYRKGGIWYYFAEDGTLLKAIQFEQLSGVGQVLSGRDLAKAISNLEKDEYFIKL